MPPSCVRQRRVTSLSFHLSRLAQIPLEFGDPARNASDHCCTKRLSRRRPLRRRIRSSTHQRGKGNLWPQPRLCVGVGVQRLQTKKPAATEPSPDGHAKAIRRGLQCCCKGVRHVVHRDHPSSHMAIAFRLWSPVPTMLILGIAFLT